MTLTIPEIKNALRENLQKRKAFYLNRGRRAGLQTNFKDVLKELANEKARTYGRNY